MSARGGTSVMARRAPQSGEIARRLNFFPTPPWAVRALLQEVLWRHYCAGELSAWEPACGAGHCAEVLKENFARVYASDVHDWGYGEDRHLDFSMATAADAPFPIDWVITNPPFTLAEDFLYRGLEIAREGVALLLRLSWMEGVERYQRIFGTNIRPSLICPFAERVPMIEGCWDPEASSATAYAWFVFSKRDMQREFWAHARTGVQHIAPGASSWHYRLADEALASRGEAARRRLAREG